MHRCNLTPGRPASGETAEPPASLDGAGPGGGLWLGMVPAPDGASALARVSFP